MKMRCVVCQAEGRGQDQDSSRVIESCPCQVHRQYKALECLRCGSQVPECCPECDKEWAEFRSRIREAAADLRTAAGKYVGWENRNHQEEVLNHPTKSYIHIPDPESDILFSIGWDGRIIATWENTTHGRAFAEDDMWFTAGYET
jgi:hypothetical protein